MTIICVVQTALLCLILWRLGRLEGQQQAGPRPDGETARKAADAVDRFNQGVANILSYDPLGKGGDGA